MNRVVISAIILLLVHCCLAKNLLPGKSGSFESKDSLAKTVFMWKPADKAVSELLRISSKESYCGKSSLEVQSLSPKYYGIFMKADKSGFKAGDTYTASAYVKAPKTMLLLIYLITYDDLWKKNKGDKFAYTKVGPDWKQLKVTFTLPRDAKILGVIVRSGGKETSPRTFYVDELKIEHGKSATPSAPDRIESEERVNIKGVIPAGNAPVIDGNLNDAAWKNALTLNRFYLTDGSGKTSPQPTEVKVMHDNKNIYFGFKCTEKNTGGIKCGSTPEKADWSDDRVEIHANPMGYAAPSTYFSTNADGIYITKMPFHELQLKPAVKTVKGNGFWTTEIALPAAAYGKSGLNGQTWYFSLGRFHRTSFKGASCLYPIKGGFNQHPDAFLPLVFSDISGTLPAVVSLGQGKMAAYSNNTSANALIFQVNDRKLLSRELKLTVESLVGEKIVSQRIITARPPFKNNRVTFYYNTSGKENENLSFTLKSGGQVIFSSKNNLDLLSPHCRVFKTAAPLFKELLQHVPAEKRTFLSWQQPVKKENYLQALKYGKAYSQALRFEELKNAGIGLIVKDAVSLYKKLPSVLPGNYYWDKQVLNMDVLARKVKSGQAIPFTVYAYYSISGISPEGKRGVTLGKNGYFGWLADPINSQAYQDSVKAVLNKYVKSIGMMWIGDEQFWLQYDKGLLMDSPHNRANPTNFLNRANQEVKEKYGFGKFGIPWGMSPKSPQYPYCRRAYISWLHEKLLETNKGVRKIVKAQYPQMPVMSDDAYGIPSVVGAQYWWQYADVGTFQLGEGGGASEKRMEPYTFTTKMVKDLSGVKKLLVVPHEALDGYPSGATTIEEARELYSQALRGGADSFHYWPSSYSGRERATISAESASEGYPLAWEYMLEVTKLLNYTPPIKFPEHADTAIFVSDEALKCDSGNYGRFPIAFFLLGTSAHGWFKFISDTMLEQGRADLNDYKIIYVPYIQYVKEDIVKKIIKYVEHGGILICGDPKAFENDISSASLIRYREKLFGIKSVTLDKSTGSLRCRIDKMSLPVGEARYKITVENNVKVAGRYDDGTPAVVEKRLGKGKAVYFGFVPFGRTAASCEDWKKFFKAMHVAEGGSVNYDVWRFKLPELEVKPAAPPEGKCLTGNYAYWNRHRFNDGTIYNLKLDGICQINRNGKLRSKRFKDSGLTDRCSIFTRPKEYTTGSPDAFVEKFEIPGRNSIVIDLKKPFSLDRLRLYYAGKLPEIKVSTSNNMRTWTASGYIHAANAGTFEVKKAGISFTGRTSQYIKLEFSILPGEKLIISELELWSK